MLTIDAISRAFRILASVGVFHQAMREPESIYPIPRPTSFRIWKTPLIADCVVGHGRVVFSKLRRSGWWQRTPYPKITAYLQRLGFFTRHFVKPRDCPRYVVRHFSGSGSLCSLIVSSVTNSPRRDLHQSCRAVESQLKPLVQKEFSKEPPYSMY